MLNVKVIGYKNSQRYCVKRAVIAAQMELKKTNANLEIKIIEVKSLSEIQMITPAFMLPSLMINDKFVCVERFPRKEEVVCWLQEALKAK